MKKQRWGVVIAFTAASLIAAPAAWAGSGKGQGTPSATPDGIGSMVKYNESNPGSGGTTMAPLGGNWEPPECWYEPRNDPKEMEDWVYDNFHSDPAARSAVPNVFEEQFHKGDKGLWWKLEHRGEYVTDGCALPTYTWIGEQEPVPPDTPAIAPEILAGLAYDKTKLPAPPLELSPDADRQVVNLETQASFGKQLDRVWVTAALNNKGINIAATTIATPSKLRIEAGTKYADPAVCEYDLVKKGGGYKFDTADAGCNIKYRRSSRGEQYQLQASLTWDVTWTDSADPDDEPEPDPQLPDGESVNEIPVTVKEVQTITR